MNHELKDVIEQITQVLTPDDIFLIGWQSNQQAVSIFKDKVKFEGRSPYYTLLVLTKQDNAAETSYMLEMGCAHIVPVILITMHTKEFENLARKGHPFARHIMEAAPVFYEVPHVPFKTVEHQDWQAPIGERNYHLFRIGAEFMVTAQFQKLEKHIELAAFSLLKACECFYRTMLQSMTGYDFPQVRSLEYLHSLCFSFTADLKQVFPCGTIEQRKLFNKFQHGSARSLTEPGYALTDEEISVISHNTKSLRHIAENFVRCHFDMPDSVVYKH